MPSTRSSATVGITLIMIASLCFSVAGSLAKPLIDEGLTPLQVTWLRVLGGALLLTAVAWPAFRRAERLPWRALAAFGLAAIAAVQAFYFIAVSRLPVGIALLLEFTGPILVVAWIKWVRRTALPRAAVVGALISLAGLACVVEVWAGLQLDGLGLLAGAGAAAAQAMYFLGGEHLTRTVDTRVMLAAGFVFGAVALTPLAMPWSAQWDALGATITLGGVDMAGGIAAVVLIVSTVAAYLAGIAALRRLSAPVTGALAYAEVVMAAVVAWMLLGEALTAPQIIGGLIVIAGVLTAQQAATGNRDATLHPEPVSAT